MLDTQLRGFSASSVQTVVEGAYLLLGPHLSSNATSVALNGILGNLCCVSHVLFACFLRCGKDVAYVGMTLSRVS